MKKIILLFIIFFSLMRTTVTASISVVQPLNNNTVLTKSDIFKENIVVADTNKYLLGKSDAKMFHGKQVGHFLLGFFLGGIAILLTAIIARPTPEKGSKTVFMSKNSKYFNDPEYLLGYKKEAKKNLLIAELIGWLTYIIIYIMLISM